MDSRRAEEPRSDADRPSAVISSGDLLRGSRELMIQHGHERYRLVLTKSNKLILIK